MFFTYQQNNSGGSFEKPAISVIIEAPTAKQADAIAEDNGLYFNGCDDGRDCSCCGDRWYEAYGKGDEVPSKYGTPLTDELSSDREWRIAWGTDEIPDFLVIKSDGTRTEYRYPAKTAEVKA